MTTEPPAIDSTASAAAGLVRVRIRLDFGGDARIGPGKIELLEAIARDGSISAAGRSMGMSYRRAWTLVDALNRMFSEPAVTAAVGGAHGGGASLTPLGERLVADYRAIESESRALANRALAVVLDRLVRPDASDRPATEA